MPGSVHSQDAQDQSMMDVEQPQDELMLDERRILVVCDTRKRNVYMFASDLTHRIAARFLGDRRIIPV